MVTSEQQTSCGKYMCPYIMGVLKSEDKDEDEDCFYW